MHGFVYFVANSRQLSIADLHRTIPVLSDCKVLHDHVTQSYCPRGINGLSGVLVAPKRHDGELHPVLQVMPDIVSYQASDSVWVCHGNHPVGPYGLQRRAVLHKGYLVEDSSSQAWQVPIVRSPQDGTTLPRSITFERSKTTLKVQRQYQRLWDSCGELSAALAGNCSEDVDDEFLISAVVEAIGINYRVGRDELSALHELGQSVLDTDTLWRFVLAMTDFKFVEDVAKKNETMTDALV